MIKFLRSEGRFGHARRDQAGGLPEEQKEKGEMG